MNCPECDRLKRALFEASIDLANTQSVLNGGLPAIANPQEPFLTARNRRDEAHESLVEHLKSHPVAGAAGA